jgi:hypothetical protein
MNEPPEAYTDVYRGSSYFFPPSMGLLLFLGAQRKILVSKKNRGKRTQQGKLVCWNVLREEEEEENK